MERLLDTSFTCSGIFVDSYSFLVLHFLISLFVVLVGFESFKDEALFNDTSIVNKLYNLFYPEF